MSSKHLVILGGGHAGSSAALAAANRLASLNENNELIITLIDKSSNLTIRPRLYEPAYAVDWSTHYI